MVYKMSLYQIKSWIERKLKKLPGIYHLGHAIRLNQEKRKEEKLNKAFLEHGYQGLKEVHEAMEKTDLKFFIYCGTLLGLIRDKALIPGDNDLDFGILEEDDFDWDVVIRAMEGIQFKPSRSFVMDDEVHEMTFTRDGLGVDFFLCKKVGEERAASYFYRTTLETYSERWEHSVAIVYFPEVPEILKYDVLGMSLNIPSNYEEVFFSNYGPHWGTPDDHFDVWDAGKMIKYKDKRAMRINHE